MNIKPLSVALIALALGLQASAQEIQYLQEIPGPAERAKTKEWRRLKAFDNLSIEIVADGKVEPRLAAIVEGHESFKSWLKGAKLSVGSFTWLQVRELDVAAATVRAVGDDFVASIPMAFGLRYQTSLIRQGTLFVQGLLTVTVNQAGKIASVRLQSYADSQALERYSRSLGILAPYDHQFLAAVSLPILRQHFSTLENIEDALNLSGATTQIESQTRQKP